MVTSTQEQSPSSQELPEQQEQNKTRELFSLDEEPKEFNEDMFIAMRNRILELEAKTVDYAPFNRSRKRTSEEYTGYYDRGYGRDHGYGYGYEGELSHHSKRPAHHRPPHHPYHSSPKQVSRPSPIDGTAVHRPSHSYPSWYTPETYMSGSNSHHHSRHIHSADREREQQRAANSKTSAYYEQEHRPESPSSSSSTQVSPHSRTQAAAHPHPSQHPPAIQPRPIQPHTSDIGPHPPPYTQPTQVDQQSSQAVTPNPSAAAAAAQQQQQRQSFHQHQHRAQQRAQSDYSRSYHLQKHMRMLDQQRAAQLAQQQQEQQQQQGIKIQRHYQPHQQMYPNYSASKPVPIQPHPSSQQQPQQPQQHQQQQQASRSNSLQQQYQQQQQLVQQQLIQRYQQHRQLQLKQQQARQLQYLRQRAATQSSTSVPTASAPASSTGLGDKLDPKKSIMSQECSNCMSLDSLVTEGGKLLCSLCIQYFQSHGKSRPVPPYRINYLKKLHCQFKKTLQDVRFQGWQDAQVLEIEDEITERDFHTVFYAGIEDGLVMSNPASRQTSVSSTANSSPLLASKVTVGSDPIVIKIEDDDEGTSDSLSASKSLKEVRTFASEAIVGELFGQRWKTEPMVGYTLVHFGGSDRTRMVPMNPTVTSLTVTFDKETNSVTYAFRVLVNGLCLLSSGGGPPALHMPEMSDDEESETEEMDKELEADNQQKGDTPDGEARQEMRSSEANTPEAHEREQSGSSGSSMEVDNV
ncbi:hypothetical protein BGX27_009602 [Mortierella sp. AM989]|nr:hypothetical protein BGX27_009602 [Mortierella sp. AM989]